MLVAWRLGLSTLLLREARLYSAAKEQGKAEIALLFYPMFLTIIVNYQS